MNTPEESAPSVMAPQRVRVLYVDDNILAAKAMQSFMRGRPDIAMTEWAFNANQAVAATEQSRPDVVLLDLDMPGVDTLGLIPRLEAAHPGVRVVMFSGHCRALDIERALDAGAAGYICKDEPTAVVIASIIQAATGACVLSPMAERAFITRR